MSGPLSTPPPLPEEPDPHDVARRSHLLPEEMAAGGSADPEAQAEAILEDSLARTNAPHDPPDGPAGALGDEAGQDHEHRRSEDTV